MPDESPAALTPFMGEKNKFSQYSSSITRDAPLWETPSGALAPFMGGVISYFILQLTLSGTSVGFCEILLNLCARFPCQLQSDCFFCMVSMSILPGTVVKLPDGRNGTVVPSPWWTPGRVLVKMRHGKKRWCRVDECIPIPTSC
jgi:hypothetical protein